MTAPYSQAEILDHNQEALTELERSVKLRPNRFSLILAKCNYSRLRGIMSEHLRQTVGAVELALPKTMGTLRQTIASDVQEPFPPALLVSGLEAVADVEDIITAANLGRDELRKRFPFPIVLWVNDRILQLINRYAPDLKSIATTPIAFDYPPGELVHSLHQGANDLFATMLTLGDESSYPEKAPRYRHGSTLRTELDFALQDIAQTHDSLDQELQASLDFLKGRDAFARGDMIVARFHFERSLSHWQTLAPSSSGQPQPSSDASTAGSSASSTLAPSPLNPLRAKSPTPQEKQAVLLFYLGATWRSMAVLRRAFYRQSLQQAEGYFRRCIEVLRRETRTDVLGKFIHALAEVYEKLESWRDLEATAREGITLHRGDPVRLARDHGYLAEVALARGHPQTAKQQAEQALHILKVADALQTGQGGANAFDLAVADQFQRSWYLYLLAKVEIALGQSDRAISLLKAACEQAQPKQDLVLYRRILETLRQQYYAQKDYQAAFHIKLKQRQVETRFRLRAFIGAGQIQPYESLLPGIPDGSTQALLATEIRASGRQADVNALTRRLADPRFPLVVVHGPSGVGKSSILFAGLIPALWRSFPEGRSTLPVLVKSYRDWPEAINQAVEVSLQQQQGRVPDETILLLPPMSPNRLVEHLQSLVSEDFLQVVLLFDQFEEFFVEAADLSQRLEFYQFLTDCLNAPFIKVVLSLREDYLHYLLEIERGFDLDIINNDILTRDQRYYLGHLQADDARMLINRLTNEASFPLDPNLVEQLVADLSTELGEVRPIELQVVGAQLQREGIQTLDQYVALGDHPKAKLAQRFLDAVIQDCGPENIPLANLVLYLLTDEDRDHRLYRPQKTREALEEELDLMEVAYDLDQLDLVLEILVGSGLVFILPDAPTDRYQLVHDYLVSYVRQEHLPELIRLKDAE
jgi:tetratricopeptide (TPR) repeat protein